MSEEDSSSTDAVVVEHHPSLWYSDGTIIIRVQSTARSSCAILFKIHKSHLARHSNVFADMLAIAGSTSTDLTQELHEGTPVIDVQDSAEDWANLLRLLYGDLFILPIKKYRSDLETLLMGAMCLTKKKKYAMDNLHGRLTSQVLEQWPRSLREWDAYIKDVEGELLEPCSAIYLANNHDLRHILPAAFYILVHTSIDRDWDTCHTNGTIPCRSQCATLAAQWQLLSISDYQKIIRGRQNLDAAIRNEIDGARLYCCEYCIKNGSFDRMTLDALGHFFGSGTQKDTLRSMDLYQDAIVNRWKKFWIHDDCMESCGDYFKGFRGRIWHRLPDIFGIEGLSGWDPEWIEN